MNKKWLALIVATVVVVGFFGLKKNEPASTNTTTKDASKEHAKPTTIEFLESDWFTVTNADLSTDLKLSGALRAVNQASIKAKVAGELQQVLVREGEQVQKGQLLAVIDSTDYIARLEQAKANLSAAQSQAAIAKQAFENNRALLDKNFISKNAYDNTSNQNKIADANVEAARNALLVAKKALDDTRIVSPMAGLVSARLVQPGEKVAIDNRLIDVVDLAKLELEIAVPSQEIAQIKVGQKVEVKVDGIEQKANGQIVRINPAITAGTRSFAAYVAIENSLNNLRVGMFAEAQIALSQAPADLIIPESAVRREGGQSFVYVLRDQRLLRQSVTIGRTGTAKHYDAVEIKSGLKVGDKVIANNLGNLTPGSDVKITAVKSGA